MTSTKDTIESLQQAITGLKRQLRREREADGCRGALEELVDLHKKKQLCGGLWDDPDAWARAWRNAMAVVE